MDEVEAARLLQVSVEASTDEIKLEYRRRLFDVHPDRGGSAGKTRDLIAAVAVLLARQTSLPMSTSPSTSPIATPSAEEEVAVEMRPTVWRVDDDTLALPVPAEETYFRLLEVAHQIGSVTYVDRQFGVLEALLRTMSGTTVSLFLSLQGRSNESTEVFFTLEPIDLVRGDLPSVFEITELVASYLMASVDTTN